MKPLQIVGILNVTPDSYFDGGQFTHIDQAVKRARHLLAEGADIVEIGGESTGPKSPAVSLKEELLRTIDIIKAIKQKYPQARLSIDTYKAEVARQAVAAGVTMINDVTAGRSDPEIFRVAAESGVDLVLMHSKDPTSRTTIENWQYDDVIATIKEFLKARADLALAAGVKRERIIIDPGLGQFISSEARYSFEILDRLPELVELGYPLFISPSRKSFLAGPENLPAKDRLPATVAASALAAKNGAHYIRTHDVAAVRRGCELALNLKAFSR